MQVVHSLEDASSAVSKRGPVFLAIGMFDGVHLGHQSVLNAARRSAQIDHGACIVLTFWPHPSRVFRPSDPTLMILKPDQKRRRLELAGVDVMLEIPFDQNFARQRAEDFLPWLKAGIPNLREIFVGENFRFGADRMGSVDLLIEQAKSLGLYIFSGNRVRESGEAISSTRIRKLITEGSISGANHLLGYPYCSEGEVVPGKQNGRKIGFPTLNVVWDPDLKPRYGVYCVEVSLQSDPREWRPAVANYGLRPTVGDLTEPLLEVHVLDGHPKMNTGDTIDVRWLNFVRPEMKFESFDQLKGQIAEDVSSAGAFFRQSPD
ncbi:MAG: riboflavin biosynthesis protein RibF [Verrucomicrobiota bacterium]